MHRLLLPVLSLLFTQLSFAMPEEKRVPGGIAVLPINTQEKTEPKVEFMQKRVAVIKNPDAKGSPWLALVGLPLSLKPGSYTVNVVSPVNQSLPLVIKKRHYPKQHIKIKNKRKVDPLPADQKQIVLGRKVKNKAIQSYSPKAYFTPSFSPPVQGRISSLFGLQRVFNGKPRNPHTGLDIAANRGTKVSAPGDGIVLATGDFFFSGNTVFLDHGKGLVSYYAHLERISVKPGQYVAQGKTIGTIGATGRATGPHLHWTIFMNQTPVDPLLFVKKSAF